MRTDWEINYARRPGFIRAHSDLCALNWFYPRSFWFMRAGLVLFALALVYVLLINFTLINERISITCFVV